MSRRLDPHRWSDEFETARRQHRRQFRVFFAIWLAMALCIVVAGLFLLTHPEVIGAFFGRIAAGAREADRG